MAWAMGRSSLVVERQICCQKGCAKSSLPKIEEQLLSVTILCLSKLIDETINEIRAQWQAQTRDEHGFVEVDHLADLNRSDAKVMS
jgi:hypothetical protein